MVCGMAHGRQKLAAGERQKTPALEPKATVGWCTFVSYQTLRVRRMVRALIGNAFCGGSVSKPQVSSLDKALGKCLKNHRLRARISQSALGKHLGVTFQQVQKFESGRNRLSAG